MTRTLFAVLVLGLSACGGAKVVANKNKPTARFTATASTVRPQLFRLDASESEGVSVAISSYTWTFGDEAAGASGTTITEPTTQHVYAAAGTYVITLITTDKAGIASEPATQTVTVASINSEAPKARITGPSSGAPNAVVTLDGSTSTGDLEKYSWSMGDVGAADNLVEGARQTSASHTYTHAGTFTVTLTVTDSLGTSDTAELRLLIVDAKPNAVCAWSPMPAQQGVPITFDSSQSTVPPGSTVSLVAWSFDDGSADLTGARVTKTFNVQNTFHAHLKVLDSMNRLGETDCPELVVGPPAACDGMYATTANPNSQSCGLLGTSTWAGNKFSMTQHADGGITITETFAGQPLVYSGSWSGNTFTATGSYVQSSPGLNITSHATIQGTFAGCGSWVGTYREVNTEQTLGPLCTITWNITGTKL